MSTSSIIVWMQNDYVVLSRDPEYELETFYSKKFPLCPLPALVTASVVAKMIRLTRKVNVKYNLSSFFKGTVSMKS